MQDEDHDDGLGGRSRDRREFAQENQRWARPLRALTPEVLARLALPDVIRDEVALSKRLGDNRAGNRAMRRVDMLISGLEPDEVARIDRFLAAPPDDADDPRVEAWFDRLVDEGDAAVSALAADHPDVDPQRVRQVLRNLRKPALRERARKALRELLLELPSP